MTPIEQELRNLTSTLQDASKTRERYDAAAAELIQQKRIMKSGIIGAKDEIKNIKEAVCAYAKEQRKFIKEYEAARKEIERAASGFPSVPQRRRRGGEKV